MVLQAQQFKFKKKPKHKKIPSQQLWGLRFVLTAKLSLRLPAFPDSWLESNAPGFYRFLPFIVPTDSKSLTQAQ